MAGERRQSPRPGKQQGLVFMVKLNWALSHGVCYTAVPFSRNEGNAQDEIESYLCIQEERHRCPLESHGDFLERN